MKKKLHSFVNSCIVLVFLCSNVYAQVGIGTTDPKSTLDVDGAISLREGSALTFSNGTNNNISLGSSVYSMYRITGPTADFSLTGIVPVSGSDGQVVILQNTTDFDLTLKHDNSSSSVVNRIYIPGERDFYLKGKYTTTTLHYSKSLSRWVLQNQLNHIETWYYGPDDIDPGYNTFTAIIPEATYASSVSVNFVGNINSNDAADLIIEFIEAQDGQVVFRILNNDAIVTDVTFAITINKI